MKCRKCGWSGSLDRATIRSKLVEALARSKELEADRDCGVYQALGYLIAAVETAVDNLDGLCFGCGHDARRAAQGASP